MVLGYLDPNNFLGGDVPLDVDAARAALEPIARHFNADLMDFCEKAHLLVTDYMREFLANMLRGRGYTTEEYTMLMYGGGGPLGMAGVVEGLDFKEILTFPFAAVFSAFGVLCAPPAATATTRAPWRPARRGRTRPRERYRPPPSTGSTPPPVEL